MTMFAQFGGKPASAYRQVGVETSVGQASPHDLVVMLFDGLLTAVRAAQGALERGDIAAKGKQIGIAVRILDEGLKGGLNLEEGGSLAGNLQNLYGYCVLRLTQANARNDAAALGEVLDLIEPLATSWKQIGQGDASPLKAA
jgi:flagellar protein FliS